MQPPAKPLLRPFVGPGRTLFGVGSSASIGSELRSLAIRETDSVLLVADATLIELGRVEPIAAALEAAELNVVRGPGVSGEPTPATIEAFADLIRQPLSAVVGIGGGSALDAAKLVAAAATNELRLTEGAGPAEILADGPLIASIPTTAGTGAETTPVAMLWHEGQKRIFVNQRLVPRHATLDPSLMAGLPPAVLAASGLDAISHAVESLLSLFRTPLTAAAAHSALRRLSSALLPAYTSPDDQLRGEMLLGAHEAGLALNASVVSGHSMAYAVAARTGLSHGVSCAMALPYCLAYCRAAAGPGIAEIGASVGTDDEPEAVLTWLLETTAGLNIPLSLSEVGINDAAIAEMAVEIVERYPRPNSPALLEVEPLQRLLTHFHSGDVQAAWDDDGARPKAS